MARQARGQAFVMALYPFAVADFGDAPDSYAPLKIQVLMDLDNAVTSSVQAVATAALFATAVRMIVRRSDRATTCCLPGQTRGNSCNVNSIFRLNRTPRVYSEMELEADSLAFSRGSSISRLRY
ncbi:hypothetical protein DD236_09635 [Ancrocorticia populi]|uniref:Uncharacterized protein n=1 Tax=Ancrocorticia populi TaxID=2175228 RepID=A0A2V1K382_9ACTO|nr:hypothetical protein DD236_09635 [Ancrocorticia populi]